MDAYFLLATGEGTTGGSGGGITTLLPFVLIFVVMYFLIIRPQSTKQKKLKNMLASMRKGDKVVTIGGIHGTITLVNKSTVIIKVDDNTKLEFNRESISSVIGDEPVEQTNSNKKEAKQAKLEEVKSEEADFKEKQ